MKKYPFKFLDAYTREDRDIFFGRNDEVDDLYKMVFETNIIVVYGASGTGKTSLIQCGLAAKFQTYEWLPVPVRRGENLNDSLLKGLESQVDLDLMEEDDNDEGSNTPILDTSNVAALKLKDLYQWHFKPVFLIFDQFEELYILGTKNEQNLFIETIREFLRIEQPVKIIISIREEYLGYLYEFERKVPELLRKKMRIEPMNLEKVMAVVEGIGQLPYSNVHLEKGREAAIGERIFEKLKERENILTIDLPYFQVFLDKLYLQITGDKNRRAEAVFTLEELEKMGDIGDVLRNFLDDQVQQNALDLSVEPDTIKKLLAPFVTFDGTKAPLSAAMLHSRLPDLEEDFITRSLQAFQSSRILRFDEKEQRYEVAHDSLARQIATYQDAEDIALQKSAQIIRTQMLMEAEKRDVFSEKQLLFMEPYLPKIDLSEEDRAWIEHSRAFWEGEKRRIQMEKDEQLAEEKRLRGEAETALGNLEKALDDIRERNISTFESFASLGTGLIYTLDYEDALDKMKVAVNIEVETQIKQEKLTGPIAELLYFFAESGRRPELARAAAELLLQLDSKTNWSKDLQSCIKEGWNTRKQFAALLPQLPHYAKFQARYYPEMVTIPLGKDSTFEMGSADAEWGHQNDEQLHTVKLSAYQMAATPTTFYQFALFCEADDRGLASRTPYWGRFGDHPAVNVSWYEAVEYANWLNTQLGLSPGYTLLREKNSDPNNKVQLDFLKWKVDWNRNAKGFRLPTEAEWELAARAGVGATRTLFAGSDTLEEVGWYWENSGDHPLSGDWDLNRIYDNNGRTHSVKKKKDNGIGIYDMSGNVYEWCWDWYGFNYVEKKIEKVGFWYRFVNWFNKPENPHSLDLSIDPQGPISGSDGRVIRGGSWNLHAEVCRTAFRNRFNPDYRNLNLGFRLVFVP